MINYETNFPQKFWVVLDPSKTKYSNLELVDICYETSIPELLCISRGSNSNEAYEDSIFGVYSQKANAYETANKLLSERLDNTILVEKIAKEHLGFNTLQSQSSDDLDFKQCSSWNIKKALVEAFNKGVELGIKTRQRRMNENF